jgi:hypothetical protein
MSIDTILKSAAPEAVPPSPELVDADLARGRAVLAVVRRRRRLRRGALGSVTLAAAAAAVIVATSGNSHSLSPTGATTGGSVQANVPGTGHKATLHTRLVDYTGAQLPGFTVNEVPQGWQLSTSTSTALLITPDASSNNQPDDFVGKLAVLTSSTDQHGLGSGDAVTVNGQPGRVSEQSGYLILNYNAPNGFGINIQAPDSLGWDDAQIVAFAEGVTVTANAVHTHG